VTVGANRLQSLPAEGVSSACQVSTPFNHIMHHKLFVKVFDEQVPNTLEAQLWVSSIFAEILTGIIITISIIYTHLRVLDPRKILPFPTVSYRTLMYHPVPTKRKQPPNNPIERKCTCRPPHPLQLPNPTEKGLKLSTHLPTHSPTSVPDSNPAANRPRHPDQAAESKPTDQRPPNRHPRTIVRLTAHPCASSSAPIPGDGVRPEAEAVQRPVGSALQAAADLRPVPRQPAQHAASKPADPRSPKRLPRTLAGLPCASSSAPTQGDEVRLRAEAVPWRLEPALHAAAESQLGN